MDIPLLEGVFAHRERDHIPEEYAACLKRLSRSHQLGLVANIWAVKAPWLAEFHRVGIGDIWRTAVFSSGGRSIKPSLKLFREAIAGLTVPLSEIVFVGDSLHNDIAPAKSLGLATVWIERAARAHPLADRVVRSLLELEHAQC